MSKKREPWIFDRPYIFLPPLKSGVKSLIDLSVEFEMYSQQMRRYLLRLIDEGFVEQPKIGLYKLTTTGSQFLNTQFKMKLLEEKHDGIDESSRLNIVHLHNPFHSMGQFF